MWFERLTAARLRNIDSATLTLSPGLNLIVGPNGAGKSSLLEAAYLLSRGHSFRARAREALIQRAASDFEVHAEIASARGDRHRIGLKRTPSDWFGRLDGADLKRLSDLFRVCAVCAFEPGSPNLIAGPAEVRRAFCDWGVFHVEPELLDAWRRYQRALRQRNALIRGAAVDGLFEPFEAALDAAAGLLATWRRAYLRRIEPLAARFIDVLVPELGALTLTVESGWRDGPEQPLGPVLAERRANDRARGTTVAGPHRADFRVALAAAPSPDQLSRGQQKLVALALTLAQAELFSLERGEWPVLLLDDLPAELDEPHQRALLDVLRARDAQTLISATAMSPPLEAERAWLTVFHVEHGRVAPASPPL